MQNNKTGDLARFGKRNVFIQKEAIIILQFLLPNGTEDVNQ